MKKLFTVLLALSIMFTFIACDKDVSNITTETQTEQSSERIVNSGGVEVEDVSADVVWDEKLTEESVTKKVGAEIDNKVEPTTDKVTSNNLANSTKAEIIEYYKKAAIKSHSKIQSSQKMILHKLEVKNSGLIGTFVNTLEPVINTVIKNNEITFDGVTGGFTELKESDAKSVKAYKDGKYTVVEMTMFEQTDGIYGDARQGTVGHAISVVGNVSTVVEQFPMFDVNFEQSDIKIHYTKPTVKVRINENGIIEKGTWTHYSKIHIKNLMINNITVGQADAEIEYVIVTGGGF